MYTGHQSRSSSPPPASERTPDARRSRRGRRRERDRLSAALLNCSKGTRWRGRESSPGSQISGSVRTRPCLGHRVRPRIGPVWLRPNEAQCPTRTHVTGGETRPQTHRSPAAGAAEPCRPGHRLPPRAVAGSRRKPVARTLYSGLGWLLCLQISRSCWCAVSSLSWIPIGDFNQIWRLLCNF